LDVNLANSFARLCCLNPDFCNIPLDVLDIRFKLRDARFQTRSSTAIPATAMFGRTLPHTTLVQSSVDSSIKKNRFRRWRGRTRLVCPFTGPASHPATPS
jgi:hypothetical protein